jgi:hypothetical protein
MKRCLTILFSAVCGFAHATEEPAYQVVQALGSGAEVRLYAPYVVAEVTVPGTAKDAGNTAFPILAGYIFGKNQGERKFDMTAPVTQAAAAVKLEMTAPVTQAAAADGFVVQFVLPRSVSLATAPEPLDGRIRLREVPARRVAAIRYSGSWTQANYEEHLDTLQSILRGARMDWVGEPVWSRYDPPFKPWFLRRNEIWLALDQPAQETTP